MEQTANSTPAEHPSFEIGKDAANSPILSTSVNIAVLESSTSGLVPTSVPITPPNDNQSHLGVGPNAGKDTIPWGKMQDQRRKEAEEREKSRKEAEEREKKNFTLSDFEDWVLLEERLEEREKAKSEYSSHFEKSRYKMVKPREPKVDLKARYGFGKTLQIPYLDSQIAKDPRVQPERVKNQPNSPSNLEEAAKCRTPPLPPMQSNSLTSKVSKPKAKNGLNDLQTPRLCEIPSTAPNAAISQIPSYSMPSLEIEPTTPATVPEDFSTTPCYTLAPSSIGSNDKSANLNPVGGSSKRFQFKKSDANGKGVKNKMFKSVVHTQEDSDRESIFQDEDFGSNAAVDVDHGLQVAQGSAPNAEKDIKSADTITTISPKMSTSLTSKVSKPKENSNAMTPSELKQFANKHREDQKQKLKSFGFTKGSQMQKITITNSASYTKRKAPQGSNTNTVNQASNPISKKMFTSKVPSASVSTAAVPELILPGILHSEDKKVNQEDSDKVKKFTSLVLLSKNKELSKEESDQMEKLRKEITEKNVKKRERKENLPSQKCSKKPKLNIQENFFNESEESDFSKMVEESLEHSTPASVLPAAVPELTSSSKDKKLRNKESEKMEKFKKKIAEKNEKKRQKKEKSQKNKENLPKPSKKQKINIQEKVHEIVDNKQVCFQCNARFTDVRAYLKHTKICKQSFNIGI